MKGPLIVVAGAERSGTTLLSSMLDSHSQVAMVYESHSLIEIVPDRQDRRLTWPEFLDRFVAHRWFARWGLQEEELKRRLTRADPQTYPEIVDVVFSAYAESRGKQRAGDKTPAYVRYLTDIAERVPDALFIHLIRDGRNCASSLREAPFGPDSVAAAALRWRTDVQAGRDSGRALGPRRYAELHYEELVADPRLSLSRACEFLGLAFEPAMTAYTSSADRVRESPREKRIHPRLDGTIRTDLREWRSQMSSEDREMFEEVAGQVNRDCGYGD
ncbi:sulfotransferase [Streptomyces sp. NPDC050433]|uniref:sulfotransferase n=1 Tax=unclassified Streptomyces TaxID=2593676 RepID=UPI0034452F51